MKNNNTAPTPEISLPHNECERLEALWRLNILDTPADPAFENLTQIAASLFNVPIVLVSLVDEHRQWFKSHIGIIESELPRKESFCGHAILAKSLFIVEDTFLDPRFATNSLVTGAPHIRFYAGAPIQTEDGLNLGTLCLIDKHPRTFSAVEQHQLTLLARQVEQLIYLHHRTLQLAKQTKKSTTNNARYKAIITGAAAGIIRIDGYGTMLQVNNSVLSMLGYKRHELLQKNVKMLMPERWGKHHDGYLEAYQTTGEKRIIGTGREVAALHKDGTAVPIHLAVSEVLHEHHSDDATTPSSREFIGILSDLRAVVAVREREAQERALLKVLHQGLTDYHSLVSSNTMWRFLKEALKDLTNSEYALIGEVITEKNMPVLKVQAISDLSWDAASRKLMAKLRDGKMRLKNQNSMLGQVFSKGKVIISNDMKQDPRGGALPEGHPTLKRYLGVPIIDRGHVIGMYALANANKDYDESLVEWLEPFTSTCVLLINLYRQLNEQQRFTEELEKARDLAERSSQAKTDFLSSMSHELRTPLNAILGFSQLLANSKDPLSERQQRQTDQILRSGKHLLNLINEVLDLARIESGHTQVSLEKIKLQDVVGETLEIISSIAKTHQLSLKTNLSQDTIYFVEADYTRLKQILLNLMSNAVKYNRPNGSVTLECSAHKNKMRIAVIDTGFGIAQDKIADLFEPFNRLGAENSSVEGTGVGLALTKKLARLMNTDVYVQSVLNEGSTFWFELPITERSASETFTTDRTKTEGSTKKYHVLYIEDNPENQRLMQHLCNDAANIKLRCASSAEIGFEIACSESPHLILMDLDLPGINGFQAQRLLKQNPLTTNIPILAVSASSTTKDIESAKNAEFVGFYTKPFDLSTLMQHIQQILTQQDS